jgi:uncharacterized membrane protein YhaH (DUF805 family)
MDPKHLIENFRRVVMNHYADFHGRAGRPEFWHYILLYLAMAVVLGILGARVLADLIALALFLPTLGVAVRRLHDIGRSGWLVLLPMIPAFLMAFFFFLFFPLALLLFGIMLVCSAYLIFLYAQPGTPGDNQYGPEPGAISA